MKAILLDADGVLLKKDELFSEKFAREYDVPLEEIVPFFKEELGDCQSGTKDVKEVLPQYLETWGWNGTVDEFLAYWFQDVKINHEMIEKIEAWRSKGIACYMASNNEYYRARAIEQQLQGVLDGFFFSADLKVRKKQSEFFQKVVDQLQLDAGEVGFVDNEEENVEAARSVGIEARIYSENLFSKWPEISE